MPLKLIGGIALVLAAPACFGVALAATTYASAVISTPTANATPYAYAAQSRRGEQNDARKQLMAGQVKSLREIEARILPKMRGMEYIGPEYDPANQIYRLKFLNDDRVVFVDVDARSGEILRQIG